MKNKFLFFFLFVSGILLVPAQNNTFSPYSRYGLGEFSQSTFAHNAGMGGAHIAHKPDSTMPIFINAGNPAAYALIRLTSLEVGGTFIHSSFKEQSGAGLNKWGTNFAYGALGFPIANNGGLCLGIMPYTQVGYNTETKNSVPGLGDITYRYAGSGGLNKAFIGYGIMPFRSRLIKFRSKHLYVADSLRTLRGAGYRTAEFFSKLLSDLSGGFNVNYIFGNISNTTRVVYPYSELYNNTFRERTIVMGDFTGNYGMQTGLSIDSIKDHKRRKNQISAELGQLRALNVFTETQLKEKADSLERVTPLYRRSFKNKPKLTFGYFATLNNPLRATYTIASYNYILTALNEEIIRDTTFFSENVRGQMRLPFEQGIGIGFKKGEKFNMVADFALTDWSGFRSIEDSPDLVNNYRVALGFNFVPEKYAAGRNAFYRKINYRMGLSYNTGYISIMNSQVSTYMITAGVGLPVGIGRLSSMVNISLQAGQTGSASVPLKENFYRINFGFTFSDKWFQKYRYD